MKDLITKEKILKEIESILTSLCLKDERRIRASLNNLKLEALDCNETFQNKVLIFSHQLALQAKLDPASILSNESAAALDKILLILE